MTATIRPNSPRRSLWLQTFGTDSVQILEPPKVNAAGALRMLVDITALDSSQVRNLSRLVSKQKRMPADRVMQEIQATGSVAISAEDVDVVEEERRLF